MPASKTVDVTTITNRLRAAIDQGEVPGVGLVVRKHGATLYEQAFGDQQVDSARLLASATKLASTTAVMSCVDDGLIDLDERIAHYLPEFVDGKGGITTRRLLSQTHGLPFGHPSIPAPLQDNGLTLADSVRQIARDLTLEVPPGTRFAYMPAASYHIAGRIAEVVTGKTWNELFDERVSSPLHMTSTMYGDMPNPRIGGGAQTTLTDYANLLQMHIDDGVFEGRRVLSAASAREMRSNQVGALVVTGTTNKPEAGYGLTWWFDVVEDGRPVQFSVGGAWGAIPWLNHNLGYIAFLLVQNRLDAAVAIYDDLLPLIAELVS